MGWGGVPRPCPKHEPIWDRGLVGSIGGRFRAESGRYGGDLGSPSCGSRPKDSGGESAARERPGYCPGSTSAGDAQSRPLKRTQRQPMFLPPKVHGAPERSWLDALLGDPLCPRRLRDLNIGVPRCDSIPAWPSFAQIRAGNPHVASKTALAAWAGPERPSGRLARQRPRVVNGGRCESLASAMAARAPPPPHSCGGTQCARGLAATWAHGRPSEKRWTAVQGRTCPSLRACCDADWRCRLAVLRCRLAVSCSPMYRTKATSHGSEEFMRPLGDANSRHCSS